MNNGNEYDIYQNCHPEIRRFLCQVKEIGYGWIIMKKLKHKVPIKSSHFEQLLLLRLKFMRYGIIPVDLRLANVGLSEDNEMVVIDYGLFIRNQMSRLV